MRRERDFLGHDTSCSKTIERLAPPSKHSSQHVARMRRWNIFIFAECSQQQEENTRRLRSINTERLRHVFLGPCQNFGEYFSHRC